MSHLTLETIARLVEETPTAAESGHLANCAACRAELDGMREDVHALSMLPDVEPAPDAWAALEQRLAGEGLIRPRRAFGPGMQRLSWAAAAVIVFMAGTMAGRMGAWGPQQVAHVPAPDRGSASPIGPSTGPATAPSAGPATAPPAGQAPPALARTDEPEPVEERARPAAQPRRGAPVTFASSGSTPSLPGNVEEAALLLRQTEELYLAALTRYAELATESEAGDPVARLAALQSIVMTTQAALSHAPADPVINGYHLTAVAQRDATLRHVAATTNDRWY